MIYHNAYCSREFLDQIFDSPNEARENDIILKLIQDHCNLFIDLEEDELYELIQENDVYRTFIRRESGECIGNSSYFNYLPEFDSSDFYINHFNDYFFIKSEFINSRELRVKSGCNIYDINDLSEFHKMDSILKYIFKPSPQRSTFNNWDELLKAKDISPINSIVLVDNYLFKNQRVFDQYKNENLFTIIKSLTPKDLEVKLEVLIVLDNREGQITKDFCERLIEELEELLGKKEDQFSCGITTISLNDDIHQRALITNNFYLWSDKGFNIIDQSKPVKPTDGQFLWNYHGILNYVGDLQKDRQIDYLTDIYKQLKKNKTSADQYKFNVGNVDIKLFESITSMH